MKKIFTKRFFGWAMSLVMLTSLLPAAAAASNEGIMTIGTVYHSNQKLTKDTNTRIPYLKFNGVVDYDNFVPMQVSWTNPANSTVYQAYCINPAYPGYGDTADYGVDIEKFDNDCIVDAGGSGGSGKRAGDKSTAGNTISAFLEGAVNYGYPTVSAETLLEGTAASYGVDQDELEYGAYLATKMAIWSGIHTSYSINSWSVNDGLSGYSAVLKNKVLAATRSIYNKAGSHTPHDGLSDVTFTAGEPKKSGSNYEVVYTIGNTDNNVPNSEMYIENLNGGAFPPGLTIVDENGDEFETITTSSGNARFVLPAGTEEVTVIIPDPGEAGTQVDLRLYAQQMKKVLLYGRSTKDAAQSYVLAGNHWDNPYDGFAINQEYVPDEGIPETPDTPDTSTGSGDLVVLKLDARDNATPLAGVTFDCYNSRGQLIDTGTTNSSGKWLPNIPGEGTYTIVERDSGDSYQLTEPTTIVITVPDDEKVTATFRDYPDQTVTMEKEDAETGKPVSGVQYEIVQIDGKGAWRATGKTDGSGKIEWDDVTDGTYMVREVSTVEGYILDPTPQYVTVRNGQAPSLKFTNSKFPGLTITKVDKQTGESIKDPATFKVEQIDGDYATTVETKGGTVNLKNLPVGSYKITELAAPEGYVVDSCPGTVYLGKDKSIQYVAYNLKAPVLTIEKIDKQTGDPVPGTKFEVKKTDGTKIGTVETGKDGTVTIGMKGSELGYLKPGTYTVTEVFVPEPYVLSGEHQDIQLNAGDTKSLMFANLEAPQITVQKYDEETGDKLEGAQFAIYEQSDLSRPVAEGMTDKNGEFTTGYIAPGTYVVTELNPPPGYMFSDKTSPDRVIVAKAGDGEIIVKVDNIKLPELTIKKVDAVTKEPIAGVTYSVGLVDDTSVEPATVTTDKEGMISLPGLAAGTYEIKEISTPHPYILNDTPQRVKLAGGDTKTLLFENIKLPTLLIQKTDATTNKGIPNTTYKIEYEQAGGGIKTIGTFKTDADGRIKLPYVEPGWYIITETIPAQGYQKPTNPVTRIYLDAGDNSYLSTGNAVGSTGNAGTINGTTSNNQEVSNKKLSITSGADYAKVGDIVNYPLNSLVIKKADANTGEMLDGATFEVYRITGETSGQNGKLICTVTTDKSGVVVITGLEAGAYAVKEIKAPQNYVIAETYLQTVNLKADGTSVVEVIFRNYPYGAISINKVDGISRQPLEGARFKVTTSAGAAVGSGEFETDANGNILIGNLAPGSYVITETAAPKGYVLSTQPVTVEVGTDGSTITKTFNNYKKGNLQIRKFDADTKALLEGATFKITDADGTVVGSANGIFTTDAGGTITLPELDKGTYIITETEAPKGYAVSANPSQKIEIDDTGKTYTVDFYNKKLGTLEIYKFDNETKAPLAGATFRVEFGGKLIGNYTTDASGVVSIPGLAEGTYKVTETSAPAGYALSENSIQTVEVGTNGVFKVNFYNEKLANLQIRKFDSETKELLAGAQFKVTYSDGTVVGDSNGIFTTNNSGVIMITGVKQDTYKVTEIKAPTGYAISDTPTQTIKVDTEGVFTVDFYNDALANLQIRKFDADTKALLAGATFRITYSDGTIVPGGSNGVFTTDESGVITLRDIKADTYTVTEIQAPAGYALSENPTQVVKVDTKGTFKVDFYNEALGNLVIRKFDEKTKDPLAGATFEVKHMDGTVVGNSNGLFTTDAKGTITLPKLEKGTYIITETKAPDGYALSEVNSKTITIDNEGTYTVDFYNKELKGVQIIKKDSQTGLPLKGAQFQIWQTGASTSTSVSSSTPAGKLIGTYTTDINGVINVVLEEGTYEILETKAPEGYQIDNNKQDIVVRDGEQTSVTFTNTKILGLEIIKIDADTKNPLQGATFKVEKVNGEKVGTYTTDSNGHIMVSGLASGTYVVSETSAPAGYVLNSIPQTVTVSAGKVTTVTFENSKKGGVVIQKLDSATDRPIEGCEFLITTFDGATVGVFETDRSGQIHLPNLTDGTYIAKEMKAPAGYNLAAPKTFQVSSGRNPYLEGASNNQTVTIYNDPLGVSQIIKTDAVTGKPVKGAVYVIAALNNGTGIYSQTVMAAGVNAANTMVNGLHTIIGRYETSENGIINISNLPEGWYTLQEEKAPEGYERDATIYNFQITGNGRPTIIQLTNKPLMGRIALTKLSADYNNNTGWDSGTPLAGAVYSILDSDGVEVDRITTGADGTAISSKLKVGTYTLKEVQAPDWYGINPNPLKVTIKKEGQVVSVVAKDPSINLMVGIKKTSDTKTCSWGDTINYYITGVGNESNVSLDKFTVHDKLPDPKAAQIKYFDTGLWSKKYNFKVAYTTNLNTAYTYLPGTYSSDRHNHIDLYAGNMGLRSGEYVTQVKMEFQGSVAPGFKLVEAISMQMTAGSNFTNGYQFTNYADVSGRWHDQYVTANSHWTIKMYGNPGKLPKTGW